MNRQEFIRRQKWQQIITQSGRRGGPPQVLFKPTDIAGCELWLDAADASTFSYDPVTTSAVREWRDKSGNLRHLRNNSTFTPWGSSANNCPTRVGEAVRFASQTLAGPDPFTPTFTILCVSTASIGRGLDTYGAGWSLGIALSGLDVILGGNYRNVPTGSSANILSVIFQQSTSSTISLWNAGAPTANTTYSSTGLRDSTVGLIIGAVGAPTNFRNGDVNEVVIFNSAIPTPQRQRIEGYLAWKWGLTSNLPASHPYKTLDARYNVAPFDPSWVSGLALWFDAADIGNGTPVPDGAITTWSDKSGNARNVTQGTSSNRPTYSSTTKQVSFSGTQWLGNTQATSFGGGTGTLFLVARKATGTTGRTVSITNSPNSMAIVEYQASNTVRTFFINSTSGVYADTTVTDATTDNIVGVTRDGTAAPTAYFNGGAGVTLTAVDGIYAVGNNVLLGAATQSGSGAFTGAIREVVFFNTFLTTDDRQRLEGYLAWKWGLTSSLSAGHPYKYVDARTSVAPFVPTQLSSLSLWLDGADPVASGTAPIDGTNLTTWADKSGNNVLFGRSGTPIYRTNVLGGLGAVRLDGSSYFTNSSLSVPGASRTVYIVGRTIGSNFSAQASFASGTTSSFQSSNAFRYTGDPFAIDVYAGNGGYFLRTEQTTTSVYIFGEVVTPGSPFPAGALFWNGSSPTLTNSVQFTYTPGASTGLMLGTYWYNSTGQSSYNGDLHEVVVVNRNLTAAERQRLEGYLAWKWGLQGSLPAIHPYKTIDARYNVATWKPTMVSGLLAWYEADDTNNSGTAASNNAVITTWKDKSGNGRDLSSTGNTRYNSTSKEVVFDGTSSSFFLGSSLSNMANISWLVIARQDVGSFGGASDMGPVWSWGSTAGGDGWFPYVSGNLYFPRDKSTWYTEATSYSRGTNAMWSAVYGTDAQLFTNGSNSITTTRPTTDLDIQRIKLGQRNNIYQTAPECLTGAIKIFMMFDRAVSTDERQMLEGYAAWKYNIQSSLPAGHPYKNAAP